MLKKYFIFLFIFSFDCSYLSADGLDYSAKYEGRVYPVASMFTGTVGYGYKIWENENINKNTNLNWKFGFVRPSLR